MFFAGFVLVASECFFPRRSGTLVLAALVVPDRDAFPIASLNFTADLLNSRGNSLLHQFLLRHEFGIAAEQNVGTATRHVGGDRDHAETSGLRDDLSFALVILRVEDDVLDALLLQQLGDTFRFFNGRSADQD